MAPTGKNDKAKFINNFKDTIKLFSRLALVYKNKIRIDGCLAITLDEGDETIVVNIAETVQGNNTAALYPSLIRVQGPKGISYDLSKKVVNPAQKQTGKPTTGALPQPLAATSAQPPTSKTTLIHTITPSPSKSTSASGYLVSVPASKLLLSPQTTTIGQRQSQPKRLLVISPSPSKQPNPQGTPSSPARLQPIRYQSLISGKITTVDQGQGDGQTPSTSALNNSSSAESESNPDSDMERRSMGDVLQAQNIDVKEEPAMDEGYGKSVGGRETRSRKSLEEGRAMTTRRSMTRVRDKENTSTRSPLRNEASATSKKDTPNSRKRRQASKDSQSGQEKKSKVVEDEENQESNKDEEAKDKEREEEAMEDDGNAVGGEEIQDAVVSSSDLQKNDESTEDEEEEDGYTSDETDGTASTVTTDDELEQELFRCSEKFTADCEKKTSKMDTLSENLKNELNGLGKDVSKDVKKDFTKAINSYLKAKNDFTVAKTKGSSDIKKLEDKLDREFQKAMDEFLRIRTLLDKIKGKGRKPKSGKSLVSLNKPSSSIQQANKIIKKNKVSSIANSNKRQARTCGRCGPCQKIEDCAKCVFCLDKTKFGGKNTLRQKCIKKQCLNLGAFKSVKGLPATVKR